MNKCVNCFRKATDRHHLIVTKGMARGVPKTNKVFWNLVNSDRNLIWLCNDCHTSFKGVMGHITREQGFKLIARFIGWNEAVKKSENFLSDCENELKIPFKRLNYEQLKKI